MKSISLILIITMLTIHSVFGQDEKPSAFIGVNPSVTVEPFYNAGELDINLLPVVYQRVLTNRLDLRLTSILNYGIRIGNDRLAHVGIEAAAPIFIKKKETISAPSNGFFIAPILSVTRNNESNHTNVGTWVEPGYSLLFENKWAMSFGFQFGGTYFHNDDAANAWRNHFGIKVIFGKWGIWSRS